MTYTDEPIAWTRTGDGEYPYQAWHAGATLHLRVNDFPAEPLYTLLVDYRPSLDLDDWPSAWLRPAPTAEQLRVAGTVQLRRGRIDAIVIADWAHRLCTAPPGPTGLVRAALDLPTGVSAFVAPARPAESADDLPPGISPVAGSARPAEGAIDLLPGLGRLEIVEAAGVVRTLHLTLTGGGPTNAELAALLGPAVDTPPEADGSLRAVFRIALPDAPFACEVHALYRSGLGATTPTSHAGSTEIRLSRQPADHAKRGR